MSNTAREILAGSDISVPVLEKLQLSEHAVDEQLLIVDGLFKTIRPDTVMPAIRERQARLNHVASHALLLASSAKLIFNKWALGFGEDRYKLWLHHYNPEEQWKSGEHRYVEQNHNHRHGLVSLIVSGGYSANEFRISEGMDRSVVTDNRPLDAWSEYIAGLDTSAATYRTGDTMTMHPDEVHSLFDIQPDTVTLVFETRPQRDYSVVFNDIGTRAEMVRRSILEQRMIQLGPAPGDILPTPQHE